MSAGHDGAAKAGSESGGGGGGSSDSDRALLGALDGWLRPRLPAERLAAVRLLVGLFALIYTLVRCVHLWGYADFGAQLFRPVGPVSLLAHPPPGWLTRAMVPLTLLLGAAFVGGYRWRISGPLFAAALLWVMSYRNSFGMIFHTENLLVLHVIAIGASPDAADAFAYDARRLSRLPDDHQRYGWPLRLASAVTVVAYLIAGVAKLRASGVSWIWSDVLRNQVAFDNLRKLKLGSIWSPVGGWLIRVRWIWPPLAAMSVVVEVGAPMAFFGGKATALWALAAWGFHVGVVVLMMIAFPYQLSGIAYASLFRVERPRLLRKLYTRLPSPPPAA